MENLKSTKQIVEELLRSNEACRDSDDELFKNYLEIFYANLRKTPVTLLLRDMKNKSIASFDTLTRARRLCQETIPKLRGNVWRKRHNLAEEVKKEVKEIKKKKKIK